jgi:ATP-dependent RNA circularization protein (DNA/RNA ligase family)
MGFKFPHTPHLAWLGPGKPRADKVLSPSEVQDFLDSPIVVEEKVDGANIGIFFDATGTLQVQNRGTILQPGCHPQFQALWPWLAEHRSNLQEAMRGHLMLFGEWCFAVHSMRYGNLPDYFVGFDVYDRHAKKFWVADRRDEWAQPLDIVTAPVVSNGSFTLPELEVLLSSLASRFGDQPAEGLYLRKEQNGWLQDRAKLVRPEFVQGIVEHWTKHALEKNLVKRPPKESPHSI